MRYLLNGHSLTLDAALCNGCGRCEEVCPHGVFSVIHRKAAIVDREACMECGACRMNCALNAIAVSSGVGCAAAVIGAMRRRNTGAESCSCGVATPAATVPEYARSSGRGERGRRAGAAE